VERHDSHSLKRIGFGRQLAINEDIPKLLTQPETVQQTEKRGPFLVPVADPRHISELPLSETTHMTVDAGVMYVRKKEPSL